MAKSLSGEVIDPYGGQRDLGAGHLRHVSAAFVEDPLRILRAARFAARFSALGFGIADETMRLLRDMVGTGELKDVPRERIWEETRRALATPSPGVFFDVLHRLDAAGQVYAGMADAFSSGPARRLAQAALANIVPLDDEPCVRFAVLVGGLCFHQDEPVARSALEVARQPGIPGPCRELLELTVNFQHACHGALELDAAALLKLLHRLDGKRRPETVCQAAEDMFCRACCRERTGRIPAGRLAAQHIRTDRGPRHTPVYRGLDRRTGSRRQAGAGPAAAAGGNDRGARLSRMTAGCRLTRRQAAARLRAGSCKSRTAGSRSGSRIL